MGKQAKGHKHHLPVDMLGRVVKAWVTAAKIQADAAILLPDLVLSTCKQLVLLLADSAHRRARFNMWLATFTTLRVGGFALHCCG